MANAKLETPTRTLRCATEARGQHAGAWARASATEGHQALMPNLRGNMLATSVRWASGGCAAFATRAHRANILCAA
eukprot:8682623-Alexandrium_andersonii.AAC.1